MPRWKTLSAESQGWADLLDIKGGASSASRLQRQRAELLEHWSADVWNWLTGIDPTTHDTTFPPFDHYDDGVPVIMTTDERDSTNPIKPWPSLPYLRLYTAAMVSDAPENRILLVDKARQMMATTATLLAWDWVCRTQQSRVILWSKITEDEAIVQLEQKVRAVHRRLPNWLAEVWWLKDRPAKVLKYHTHSVIQAVNQVAARGAARGQTASRIGVDEAAYQDAFPAIWTAAMPMSAQLVALTTATVGPPGATFFNEKIAEGRRYAAAKPGA